MEAKENLYEMYIDIDSITKIVKATSREEAIEKLNKWIEENNFEVYQKENGELERVEFSIDASQMEDVDAEETDLYNVIE